MSCQSCSFVWKFCCVWSAWGGLVGEACNKPSTNAAGSMGYDHPSCWALGLGLLKGGVYALHVIVRLWVRAVLPAPPWVYPAPFPGGSFCAVHPLVGISLSFCGLVCKGFNLRVLAVLWCWCVEFLLECPKWKKGKCSTGSANVIA